MLTKKELIAFEDEIAEIYATGAIRGPIHLNDNHQADSLIRIFQDIKEEDYIFSTWRNHWHYLLKGVPRDLLKEEILAGRSMGAQFPKYKAYSSAIVGGCLPIAVGVAWALKQQSKSNKVFVFLGDMAAMCGIATECFRYAVNFQLPLHFVIEENAKSVGTPTYEAWNQNSYHLKEEWRTVSGEFFDRFVTYYSYEMTRPHSGIGSFVSF